METIEYFYGPIGIFAYIFGIILLCALKDYCKRDDSAERMMEIEALLLLSVLLLVMGRRRQRSRGLLSLQLRHLPP